MNPGKSVAETCSNYKYRLVVFVNNKNKKEIDIVPSFWIFHDEKADTIKCKFMPPPYNAEKWKTLSKMVQNCEPAINDWPDYLIDIRGRAKTYQEANELAAKLEYNPFAYSTQNEETAKSKAADDVNFFKNKTAFGDEPIELLNNINIDLSARKLANKDHQISSQKLSRKPLAKKRRETAVMKQKIPSKNTKETIGEESSSYSSTSSAKENRTQTTSKRKRISSSSGSSSSFKVLRNRSIIPTGSEKSKDSHPAKSVLSTSQHKTQEFNIDEFEKLYSMIDARFQTMSNVISDKFDNLQTQYNSLSLRIGQLSGKVIEIEHHLKEKHINLTNIETDSNDENVEIQLPCKSKIDFDQFNEKLKTDTIYKKKITRKLLQKVNKRLSLTRNVAELLRCCISRDVGIQYAPIKPSKNKPYIFKNTTLYKVIAATLRKAFSRPGEDVPDQGIIEGLGAALHNCKDWDGGRTARSKQKKLTAVDSEVLDQESE